MDKKMNYKTFEDPLGEWALQMKPFIEGEEMWELYQKIKNDVQTERKINPTFSASYPFIVPRSSETFRAFKTCQPKNLKVVFYLQDPYPRLYKDGVPQACGIAMDCRNSPDKKIQPSLI